MRSERLGPRDLRLALKSRRSGGVCLALSMLLTSAHAETPRGDEDTSPPEEPDPNADPSLAPVPRLVLPGPHHHHQQQRQRQQQQESTYVGATGSVPGVSKALEPNTGGLMRPSTESVVRKTIHQDVAASPTLVVPGSTVDERSWWARWNSSLVGVSVTVQAFNGLMLLGFTQLPPEFTGWNEPEFRGLRKNFTEGPRVDNDRFVFNYVAHPLAGSEFYMIGRNRGLNWWQGLTYSAVMSAFFEFFVESVYEQASWQDLWITPVSGIVLGELRWRIKKALEHPVTGKPVGTISKILYVVIDPFDPIFNL